MTTAAPAAAAPHSESQPADTSAGLFVPPERLEAARQRLADTPATLVVVDPASGRTLASLGSLSATDAAPPCSTYKIPNTLIALAEGAVSVDDHAIPRDHERIPDDDWRARGKWAEDQDLLSALRFSTVWYFQELARRVGPEAMADWLATFNYGNQDVSGGLETFWLGSSLRISAAGQAKFVAKLVRGDLPVADEHLGLLKQGIRRDGGEALSDSGSPMAWLWFGKTGACQNPPSESVVPGESYGDLPDDTPWVGWLVGWIERTDRGPVAYAFRVEAANYGELTARRDPLIRPLLTDLGLLP